MMNRFLQDIRLGGQQVITHVEGGGLIHVLNGGTDYSNGAVAWDGIDLAIKGTTHPKGRDGGFSLSGEHYNAFINSYNWNRTYTSTKIVNGKKVTTSQVGLRYQGTVYSKPNAFTGTVIKVGTGKYTTGRVLYQSASVHGQHLFWKPNSSDTRNKGYDMKGLVQFKF